MMTQHGRKSGMVALLTAGFCCATFLASCQEPKPGMAAADGPPKIEVVGGETVSWGEVGPGVLKHALQITNVGGDTLRISDVKASCGCTTAPLDKKVLLPGDTATVNISMDVSNRTGEQHKSITITSNDSTRSSISVGLTATVVRDVVATPEYFPPINDATKGHEDSTSVELRNAGEQPITIQPPVLTKAAEMIIRFDMDAPVTLQPGEARRVVAFVKPIKDGTSTAEVVFSTDGKREKEVKLNLTATVM